MVVLTPKSGIVRCYPKISLPIDVSQDWLTGTSYNLKVRPVRENKIDAMKIARELDMFSCFFCAKYL